MARAQKGVRIAAAVLCLAGLAVFLPLWAPLVLAAWCADLVRPLVPRLERVLGGRRFAAGVLSVTAVLLIATPLAMGAVLVASRARELLVAASHAGTPSDALEDLLGAVKEHGGNLWPLLSGLASASASALLGGAVFVVALYALSVEGRRAYAWLARSAPLDARARCRLSRAFRETGRGLLVGVGGTACAQGTVAAIAYAALGVRNPITLGVLTGVASLVPAVGTATVWVPLSIGLALEGRRVSAAILLLLGFAVIGTVDNLLRPWLARVGHLRLPMVVVFLSMMGGLRLIGGWGLLLGPLLVRLAVEARAIVRGEGGPAHGDHGESLASVPMHAPAADPDVLNLALELSLEFGPNWRKPIQERLRAQRPQMASALADELDAYARQVRDWAHDVIARAATRDTAGEEQARDTIRRAVPWIDEPTLAHLWSQGVYYARK
jgi:predicted PurR-regulated permease PerM